MFSRVQKELNELIELTHQTAMFSAALTLDPTSHRTTEVLQQQQDRQQRKMQLMVKYDLSDNVAFVACPVRPELG